MKKMEKGFTLVELMIVVAIIAILAAVAVPNLAASANKAKDSKAIQMLSNARTNLSAVIADLQGAVPNDEATGAGNGLWKKNGTDLVSRTDANIKTGAIGVTGVNDADNTVLKANYGSSTGPTFAYTDFGVDTDENNGKGVNYNGNTTAKDAKGQLWSSY